MKQPVYYIIVVSLMFASCTMSKPQPAASAQEWQHEPDRSVDISEVTTVLPQAGNVELVELNCVPCHSLRYIEMQPAFPYKTWEKIVDKMINVYGAPVRDSATRANIINYLYAIRGEKEQ